MNPRRAGGPGGGAGPTGRFFGPGELRLALLCLIDEQPGHGYELMSRLEDRFAGAYKASAGAIYPTLQQVDDEGLVRIEPDGGRKVFHITPEGRAEVRGRAREADRIWARATQRGEWGMLRDPHAAEIVTPALRLFKAAVSCIVRAHGDPVVVERVREVLDNARREMKEIKAETRTLHRARRHHHRRGRPHD
ncbi:PadR family transcriptional regulator [Yinghuangia soli]|uniref:PadR family transcriptional regulator n=1 Tax=Yinghuangia soli TaxID=2908204 RepID=A0AA41Q6N8_9ACTN|nr:PadR family transcriptional regulator [Yinghuangia soli]MCF2531965.1 PadR family transcriptional regulator [Yinghuangia soli]